MQVFIVWFKYHDNSGAGIISAHETKQSAEFMQVTLTDHNMDKNFMVKELEIKP